MMGVFGEEVHDALVPSSLLHQIIQHQEPPIGLGEPLIQVSGGGNALEEGHERLHLLETGLPAVVGVDHPARFLGEHAIGKGEEILHQHGFSAAGGTRHNHARGLSYHFS